jgi:hypothetical protein
MFEDNQAAVDMTIGAVKDLLQKLKGNGFPKITAANSELRAYLESLRDEINQFLKGSSTG